MSNHFWYPGDKVRVKGLSGVWRVVREDVTAGMVTVAMGDLERVVKVDDLEEFTDGKEPFQVGDLAYIKTGVGDIPVRVVRRGYHDVGVRVDTPVELTVMVENLLVRDADVES